MSALPDLSELVDLQSAVRFCDCPIPHVDAIDATNRSPRPTGLAVPFWRSVSAITLRVWRRFGIPVMVAILLMGVASKDPPTDEVSVVVVLRQHEENRDRMWDWSYIFLIWGAAELVNLQNARGKAKPYQIRQFLKLVEEYNLKLEDDGP